MGRPDLHGHSLSRSKASDKKWHDEARPEVSKKNGFSYHDPLTGKIWKKVLYEQNPFPDNYTPDECFLAAIEKNKNLYKYTFWQCLQGSCQVMKLRKKLFFFVVMQVYFFHTRKVFTSEPVSTQKLEI